MQAALHAIFSIIACFCTHQVVSGCTTLAIGKKASADGSVMLAHTQDDSGIMDARLCRIPAMDHPDGSLRPVSSSVEGAYPRYVGNERGECYLPQDGQQVSTPIGYVPQVKHTYAYFEADHGVLNEHGLGMTESTCSSVFEAKLPGDGGKALLSINELTRIAMERATKARDAVMLMGSLAEQYGFYGIGFYHSVALNGESVIVADANEVYIFHILPHPEGTGAIWAAQRVPDDQVTVVANMFVIRHVDFEDSENYLFSDSVRSVALERGWWRPGEAFDFTKFYSAGEYTIVDTMDPKYTNGRRHWMAYRIFGVDLDPFYGDLRLDAPYPVTAAPNRPISMPDLFRTLRDYYQGTPFDMTQGLAAGAWGDPDRWNPAKDIILGSWERSIGQARTSYSYTVQLREASKGLDVLWYGPHVAAGTVYFPVPAIATKVPKTYMIADPFVLNRSSVFWAHRYSWNVAKIKYNYAMKEISAEQARLEDAGMQLVATLDAEIKGHSDDGRARLVNEQIAKHATQVLERCWGLADVIVGKYADGWLINGTDDVQALGYPNWWLKATGFTKGRKEKPERKHAQSERCVRACPSGAKFEACLWRCTRSRRSMAASAMNHAGFGLCTVLFSSSLALLIGFLLSYYVFSLQHGKASARQSLLQGYA